MAKQVRRQSLPAGTFTLVPPQLLDAGQQGIDQLFTIVIPETGPAVLLGALTGDTNVVQPATGNRDAEAEPAEKRQVLTGLENIIAQSVSDEAPPDRSGFFGIDV